MLLCMYMFPANKPTCLGGQSSLKIQRQKTHEKRRRQTPGSTVRYPARKPTSLKKKIWHLFLDHLVIQINKGFNFISLSHYNTHSHGVTSFFFFFSLFVFFFCSVCVTLTKMGHKFDLDLLFFIHGERKEKMPTPSKDGIR